MQTIAYVQLFVELPILAFSWVSEKQPSSLRDFANRTPMNILGLASQAINHRRSAAEWIQTREIIRLLAGVDCSSRNDSSLCNIGLGLISSRR